MKSSLLCVVILCPVLGAAVATACDSSDPDTTRKVVDAGRPDAATADTSATQDTGSPAADAAPEAAADTGSPAADAAPEAAADTGSPTADAAPEAAADAGCAAYTGAIPNDAGAQCHDLANTAPRLSITVDNGTLPVGTGGTFGDGLYHMTEVRAYPGSPLPLSVTFKIAILVVGDTSYSVNDNSNEVATVRKITKRNPDGGAGIDVCTTKVAGNEPQESSSTATCNSLTTYDTAFKFSTTLTRQ